jgi:asparagine synthase (glutamine-hydrolysing)
VSFDDSKFDESEYQKEATEFLGTQHSDVRCKYDDIARVFQDVIWHTEQPILRTAPAPLYMLARSVRGSDIKVVLTGEGADEVLGGYDIFKEAKIRRFGARRPDSQWRHLLLKRLYPYIDGMQRQSATYLKNFFHVSSDDLASPFFSHLPRWDLTAKLKVFFSEDVRAATQSTDGLCEIARAMPRDFSSWHPFNQAEYLEAMYLLPGYILSSQGDRMAMAHSVEGRYPFLDHRVVEFAARLHPGLKMKVLDQKYLLKRAANGLIPKSIQTRFKQPYRAPDGKSFFAGARSCAHEFLSAESIKRNGIFNPSMVAALVAKFENGRGTSVADDMALVGILSTEVLLDQFVQNPSPSVAGRS